ncbi:hypothetical protein C10C_0190 [Chlamydia serpentis]|uniref:Uncharacterized protein n=1 Tax=Chlamydia serpentis TaxID=1967782 RepID=A0A2R8FAA9_9CHLA|nr:hypothetical protein [Chlamydia serpentis]SPN73370.1 hypothetical protein C10C_0190 [Chlamydia serpentis]
MLFESYINFLNTAASWPKPLRILVQGRYFVDSELIETPYRIRDFKSTSLPLRVYRSLPIVSTVAGIIRLIEASSGPIHSKDKTKYRLEIVQAIVEILGLGILILVIDIVRCVLAILIAVIFNVLNFLSLNCKCFDKPWLKDRVMANLLKSIDFLA